MEGGFLNRMEQKGKAKAAAMVSKDMMLPSLGSSCYGGENTPLQINLQHSPVAILNSGVYNAAGSASMSVCDPSPREKILSYPCRYCKNRFSTAQALGGHQNTHRFVREQIKKQRVHGHTPKNSSLEQPNYGCSPNSLAHGHYKLPLYNSNTFSLPARPPIGYSHTMLGLPTTKYPQSTTGLTLCQPGQPSDGQLQVCNKSRMIKPNTLNINNVNANYTSGNFNFGETVVGGQGGSLEGFGAANANIINSMGISGDYVRGRGCTKLGGNSCFPFVGYEATGTSGNFFCVSQGESNVRGHDGTIDLLSRVGMRVGEDKESNGKAGNRDFES
ncbi:hypothetical protein SSX86_004993 [Deinandra increscens subsp. villosa]|uniref:C2H2-type domain-containing protein n=1 Tax=Deinandra increscens subsp. villosa TaxID=3103831 RepID=A0AAP0DT02_9ASTR